MKKSITLLLFLATTLTAFAQESYFAILLNNANSRLNYGSMNSSFRGYKKDVRGFQGGLSLQTGITKHFSIVTEAYYVKKGGTVTADNPVNGVKSTLKLHTIEVPVLARIHAGRFYFNAGPYANYIFSGKTSSDLEETRSITFGDGGFRHWEAGVQGGAGWQFAIKKTKIALDVRYTHGLTSISKADNLYNRTISLNILTRRSKRQG
ncbi:MAG TPA: porin family protein [Cyclobacteriaceae bacterium]|nr:porin family protein [Cyclobacteriaceae bacterium]